MIDALPSLALDELIADYTSFHGFDPGLADVGVALGEGF